MDLKFKEKTLCINLRQTERDDRTTRAPLESAYVEFPFGGQSWGFWDMKTLLLSEEMICKENEQLIRFFFICSLSISLINHWSMRKIHWTFKFTQYVKSTVDKRSSWKENLIHVKRQTSLEHRPSDCQ